MDHTTRQHPVMTPAAERPVQADPDAVRVNPLPTRFGWLPGVFLLVVVALGTAAALLTPATYRWPTEGSFVQGEQAARYEEAFNEALPFRDAAVATWGVLEYALFREGREGVVVGREGWLFTDEEFTFYDDAAAETARKLAYIGEVRGALAERNVALIVALVPDKARVYSEFVGRKLPSYTQGRYESFRRGLLEQNIVTPDLLSALTAAKAQGPTYLRTDTHWTPAGAEVAAETLAEALRTADVPGLFGSTYTTEITGTEPYRGDLFNFLPLGALKGRLGPGGERLEGRQTTATGDSAGGKLFGAQTIPVTLVGTSYSADERWNFTGALQTALGADVLNLATEGHGPLPPMREYLASPELRDAPPSVVVWEIPERYVPMAETP